MIKAVQINSTETSSFDSQLRKLMQDTNSKLHLKVHKMLRDDELMQLEEFIEHQKPFPITKFSLQVDLNTLKNQHFLASLATLNRTLLSGVELIFSAEEMQHSYDEIIDTLTNTVAPMVSYPIQIGEFGAQGFVIKSPS